MKQRAQIAETKLKWAVWQILSEWGTPSFFYSATMRLTEAHSALDDFEAAVHAALGEKHDKE